MFGSALSFAGFEIGLGILGLFCLISLVWMAFNSCTLLFAIADAERVEVETSPQPDESASSILTTQ